MVLDPVVQQVFLPLSQGVRTSEGASQFQREQAAVRPTGDPASIRIWPSVFRHVEKTGIVCTSDLT